VTGIHPDSVDLPFEIGITQRPYAQANPQIVTVNDARLPFLKHR
jgi:hypothetical protein